MLKVSVSGIRGIFGRDLTPEVVESWTKAYALWLKEKYPDREGLAIVIGSDARPSRFPIKHMIVSIMQWMGITVYDAGLIPTPTAGIAIRNLKAEGGIMVTASHNPEDWNALKFFNAEGEFLIQEDIERLKALLDAKPKYATWGSIGQYVRYTEALDLHIKAIISNSLVKLSQIEKQQFRIVVDPVNSVGAIAIPKLLRELGVPVVELINDHPPGLFAHKPEPLEENLQDLMKAVRKHRADLGIAVDPDADRLALVTEAGTYFGEEYTLVAAADYVLNHKKGPVVSNVASSMALKKVAEKYGVPYYSAPVGEINVVRKMKGVDAVIGGEGNGGVIFPEIHPGRDSLTGIALILSGLAEKEMYLSEWKKELPHFEMVKENIHISESINIEEFVQKLIDQLKPAEVDRTDGVKLLWEDSWVLIRESNTEPLLRIYAEAPTKEKALALVSKVKQLIQ